MERLQPYLGWLGEHLTAVVLVASAIDATGLPFPGRLVLLAAGAFAQTWSSLGVLVLAGTAGSLIGDHLLYAAGALGGSRVLGLYCRVVMASGHCVERTMHRLERLGAMAILLGRFSAGVRLLATTLAGSGRISYWRFVLYDAAGSAAYVALFLALGNLFGARALERSGVGQAAMLLVPLALGSLIGWRLLRRQRHGPASAERLRPGGPRRRRRA